MQVFQLETAMGSAIECFEGASAVVVPRSRFAPVKTCNDLFVLRSDAYNVTPESTVVLAVPEVRFCSGMLQNECLPLTHPVMPDYLNRNNSSV